MNDSDGTAAHGPVKPTIPPGVWRLVIPRAVTHWKAPPSAPATAAAFAKTLGKSVKAGEAHAEEGPMTVRRPGNEVLRAVR